MAAALIPALRSRRSPVEVERETYVMGTLLKASVTASSRDAGMAAIEAVFEEMARWESVLSSWREDSELSRLNASPLDQPQTLSPELLALLGEVYRWAEQSGGAFDPAVGLFIDAWDLRGEGTLPSEAELAEALEKTGLGAFDVDEAAGQVIRRHDGAWITAGGFGKGAALRTVRSILLDMRVEAAAIDFGGQLLIIGSPEGDEGLVVGVAHPSRRAEVFAKLKVHGGSVATSAASERFVEVDGKRYGHILDPRTGWPVPAWGSVTVVTNDPLVADMAATTLFVLGPDEGMARAERWKDVAVFFLRQEGEVVTASWTEGMEPWLLDVPGWEPEVGNVEQ
jgi:thiamine biosynthesis lipoprotein